MGKKDSVTEDRLTRRTVLKAACTVGATIVAATALAQQPTEQTPRVKGPRVWLDMDQKEIDDAYDQSVWAPNQPHVGKRRAASNNSISIKPRFRTLRSRFSSMAARGVAARPKTPLTRPRCS